jgi:hypothetical protein
VTLERFRRGNHSVKLNFGDCLNHAVARLAAEPLLFVGERLPRPTSSPPEPLAEGSPVGLSFSLQYLISTPTRPLMR